jgi:diguanylate cyclase (GGDEF)-like protein
MKSALALAAAFIQGLASVAFAASPAPLTTLRAIHAITNAQASQQPAVDFEATVTYVCTYQNVLFVQDGEAAVFVRPLSDLGLVAGDRIRVEGAMQPSFHPIVIPSKITFLHHGDLPPAVPASFSQLIRGERDSQMVTIQGIVRAADFVASGAPKGHSVRLEVVTEGGSFEVDFDEVEPIDLGSLLDANVEVSGITAGKFDDKMQQTGIIIYLPLIQNIKILSRAGISPWSLPLTTMDRILDSYHVNNLTARIRVHGTVTFYQPGVAVVLQDGSRSLWIATHTQEPLQIGDEADATGFAEAHDRFLTLVDGEIQDRHIRAPISPPQLNWHQLAFWSSNSPDGHQYDLVSTEGLVETEVRESTQDEYVLSVGGQLFTATYRHPPSPTPLPPMKMVPLGSRVRVTGICLIVDSNPFNPGQEVPFEVLLRSFDDITVASQPPLLNVRNLIVAAILLLLAMVAATAWGWTLKIKVHKQTAALAKRIEAEAASERHTAQLEQRRSRILEEINGTSPLATILEEIAAMTSFRLAGAPCWCELAGGATLGNRPPLPHTVRLVQEEISGRSGAPLGVYFAALDTWTPPADSETEALQVGARAAALAIETRKLYADLTHRSEFDLLTDVHNRFSLDRQLDAQIFEARQKKSVFGLIYIDLDKFKQINDRYGHRIGDLYLQEAALRMKRQLRGGDMLARLGGDEFAALLTTVRGRADIDEIAHRLERCFDAPFLLEGYELHGSASVGLALFPDNGYTRDSLLSAADASMYEIKNSRRKTETMSELQSEPVTEADRR